jgi:peptide deformylase
MSLEIVHYNDPVLRKKGEKITAFDAELASFADLMINAMHEAHGIGLAAQQVGRPIQMCVMDLREAEADFDWIIDGKKTPLGVFMPMVLVNPKVTTAKGTPTESLEEGCLSFPEIRAESSFAPRRSPPSSRTRTAIPMCCSAMASSPAASSTRSTT